MSTTLDGIDVVHEGKNGLLEWGVVFQSDLHADLSALTTVHDPRNVKQRFVNRCLRLVQEGYKLFDPAFVAEIVLLVGTFLRDYDPQSLIKESQLAETGGQDIEFEFSSSNVAIRACRDFEVLYGWAIDLFLDDDWSSSIHRKKSRSKQKMCVCVVFSRDVPHRRLRGFEGYVSVCAS